MKTLFGGDYFHKANTDVYRVSVLNIRDPSRSIAFLKSLTVTARISPPVDSNFALFFERLHEFFLVLSSTRHSYPLPVYQLLAALRRDRLSRAPFFLPFAAKRDVSPRRRFGHASP